MTHCAGLVLTTKSASERLGSDVDMHRRVAVDRKAAVEVKNLAANMSTPFRRLAQLKNR